MEKGSKSVLVAEIKDQLRSIDEIFQKISSRKTGFAENVERTESLGYQIHNLYCAFEDLFRIVAGFFENNLEVSDRWHINLLRKMRIEIPGVRPALISPETHDVLNELRAFRHLFRHAYSYELDPKKIELLLEKIAAIRPLFERDVKRFVDAVNNL
ncbi:MAG: hypothetical protein ACTSU5_02040 [Promethearchaeota archaeon]